MVEAFKELYKCEDCTYGESKCTFATINWLREHFTCGETETFLQYNMVEWENEEDHDDHAKQNKKKCMEKSAQLVWLNYHYHINKISYRDMSKNERGQEQC